MLTKFKVLHTERWHEGKKSIMLSERPGIETFQGDNFFQFNKMFYKVKRKFTCITLEDLLSQRPQWPRGKINVIWPTFNRFESLSRIKRYKFGEILVEYHKLIISVGKAQGP